MALNETHSAQLTSWVASANTAQTDFPIQNLPFGVFRHTGSKQAFRVGVAIGDDILDLTAARATSVFNGEALAGVHACCAWPCHAPCGRVHQTKPFWAPAYCHKPKPNLTCLPALATTPISIPRCTTPPMSAN